MAGDWIPMRTDLWDCPQVMQMLSAFCPQNVRIDADTLSHKCKIIGALHRTWSLFDTYSHDGKLVGYDAETLNRFIGIDHWAENLQHVGWLVVEPQCLVMPDFETWMGRSAKRRMQETRRKKNARKTCPQNVRTHADKMRTTGQDRTGQKNTPLPPLPEALDCAEFRAAWDDWLRHRKEIGHPVKATHAATLLKQCAVWGVSRAVAAITHTITMGWQGLREPDTNGRRVDAKPVLHSADVAKQLAQDWRP